MSVEPKLILIAIGPVQPFIAAARKIRDLWYGSHLLSEISKSVARSLREQRCELVYPAPGKESDLDPNSDLNVANKIMAIAPGGLDSDEIVRKAREAHRDAMTTLAKKARDDWGAFIDLGRFDAQIPDYGEFYAVWVNIEGGEYDAARRRAEALLAARKVTRTFVAPTWNGFGLPKNSLDGARETVITNSKTGPLVKRRIIKKNEDLDALGLVKRWGGLNPPAGHRRVFDTLSDLAADPYIRGLEKRGHGVKWSSICKKAGDLGAKDADLRPLLFEGRLDAWIEELENPPPNVVTELRTAIQTLLKDRGAPSPYACILHADGDHMGAALNRLQDVAHHRLLSTALAAFAGQVADIVTIHHGTLIYSGGDDVLAFLPLDTALTCANNLNAAFSGVMEEAAKALARETVVLDPSPTLSCGIAIVHHLEPLFRSLETARRAERLAKGRYGKNALAIVCETRGGGTLEIGGKWKQEPASILDVYGNRFERLCELSKGDKVPGRLAYQLRRVAKELDPTNDKAVFEFKGESARAEMAGAEALRIIRRKDGAGAVSELQSMLKAFGELRAFADEMIVAGHIANAMQRAEGFSE